MVERNHFEDLDADGRIILKSKSKQYGESMRIHEDKNREKWMSLVKKAMIVLFSLNVGEFLVQLRNS
jgi:hypothetical protein